MAASKWVHKHVVKVLYGVTELDFPHLEAFYTRGVLGFGLSYIFSPHIQPQEIACRFATVARTDGTSLQLESYNNGYCLYAPHNVSYMETDIKQ
jgi:hypothetical protein